MVGVLYKTNQQLEAEEQQVLEEKRAAEERQNQSHITSLASWGMQRWEAAKMAKQPIEQVALRSLRQRNGQYDPDRLAQIQEYGGSEIFMSLTDEKCAAFESWLNDIILNSGEKPWAVDPTPVPELKPEQVESITSAVEQEAYAEIQMAAHGEIKQELIPLLQAGQITNMEDAKGFILQGMEQRAGQMAEQMQQRAEEMGEEIRAEMEKLAKEARDRIETKLHDVIVESGWEDAISEAISDMATFPAGIVKGPVLRRKKKFKWTKASEEQGVMDEGFQGNPNPDSPVEVTNEVCIDFNAPSFFDIYPFPNARKPEDGIIERHKLTRRYLNSLIGVKGYDSDAIRMVLKEYGQGNGNWLSVTIDQQRNVLENRPYEEWSPDQHIDALQIWGDVQGLTLLNDGLSPEQIQDPFADYSIELWLIGKYVIKAELNGDPLGRVPYNFASFRKRNGSLWGSGPPESIRDSQNSCNAAARNIINNMGISSGPQVDVDIAQLPDGADVTEMYPWKIWQSDTNKALGGGASRPPIRFFVPPSVANDLIGVYKFFSEEADNKIGIPKFSYGGDSKGGALGTASGFSMMMNNASRNIKNVVKHIDKGIIKPTIERTQQLQIYYFKDPEFIAGDIKIIARGSTALIAKEQAAVRRNELLSVVLGSKVALGIIGKVGLASMLSEIFKSGDFQDTEIVPTKKEMMRREEQEQQAQLAQMQQEQAQLEAPAQVVEHGTETNEAGAKKSGKDYQIV